MQTVNKHTFNSHSRPLFPPVAGPIYFFRRGNDGQLEHLAQTIHQQREKPKKEQPKLCCRNCGHVITSPRFAMKVAGEHRHSFINPAGIHYHIGCFVSAPGCTNNGEPTSEFTWFQGYTWRYSVCTACYAHLGWFFQSGESHFYGLILNRLTSKTDNSQE